ncbi:MAG: TonB-dependent receptor domain-containing protein [Sphingomonadaceae bacterium]
MHLAVASACCVIALPGHAQQVAADTAAPTAQPEEKMDVVTVSGSRIASRGFNQPTPTTTLTAAELEKNAKPNVFNTLIELPALQGSTGRTTGAFSTSSGTQGLSSLSLRGLSPIRTLTLLDGQRVVGANVSGVTDVSQFPQLLIKRVDVVTGGASASYGSDAVGGVVNFITDKKFKGFKANLEGGQTTYGDDKNGTVQTAFGNAFLDGRLHLVGSAEYGREKGVPNPGFGGKAANGRDWYKSTVYTNRGFAATTDGKPQLAVIDNAQQIQYAKYGLITEGPLRGTTFGENGAVGQFQYGNNCVGSFCQGGDLSGNVGAGTSLGMDLTRKVLYGRAGFDINADHQIYMTATWSEVDATFSPNPGAAKQGNLTMRCDNPYLPQSVRDRCAAAGITTFRYGTANANFPQNIDVNPNRTMQRIVAGAEGNFNFGGKTWGYNGYLEHGENEIEIIVKNMTLNRRYDAAIQAVRAADGTIQCANPVAVANGCKPINVFGNMPIDPAAWAYIAPTNGPHQYSKQKQDVASFNVTGEPFDSWAGPVAIATGAEWRKEQYFVTGDPYGNGVFADSPNTAAYPADPILSQPEGNHWYAGNYHNGKGSYSVKEAYLEANIPLLSASSLGDINLNLAGRKTHYSTSGSVNSWKVGATWNTGLDGWRVRAVTSQDVRAPNLSELFAAPVVINAAVNFNGQSVQIQQRTIGNTNLRPEIARNTVLGLVLAQPSWLPGFSASVDYFDVKVRDVISSMANQTLVDLCVAGNKEICSTMQLTGPAGSNYVTAQAFNLASLRSKGYDIEMAYRTKPNPLGIPGSLTFRVLGTKMISFLTNSGIPNTIPSEGAGVNMGNTPDWKVLASQNWDHDKWNVNISERWISDGVRSKEFIECQTNCPVSTANNRTIFDNSMKGAFYVDLGGSYKWSNTVSIYAKIDNVGNVDPVAAPQENPSYAINPALYDVLGRTYRVGLRYQF